MRLVIVCLCFLRISVFSFSQDGTGRALLGSPAYDSLTSSDRQLTDSLVRKAGQLLADTTKLFLLVQLSENCEEIDILPFADPAQKLADDLLKKQYVQKNNSLRLRILNKKALALNNIGYLYWQQGNVSGGLGFFKLSMQIRKETGDKEGLAESLNNIGEIYRLQGNIPEGLGYLDQSLKVREEIGDTAGTIISLNNIALIYLQQDAFDKSMEYYKRGLVLAEARGDKLGMGYIMHNIAYVYQTKRDTANLIDYQDKALALFKEVNYPQGLSIVLNNKGALHMNRKEYAKALDCFTQAKDIMKNVVDVSGLSLTLINLGNLHFNMNEFDKALDYGLQAMKTSRETGYPENIQRASLLLYNCYKARKDYAKALEMHELHMQMRDSIFNEANRKSTYKQQMKYEYEKQEALKNAEHRNELKVAEEGKKRQQVVSYSVGAGLLMLTLFSLFIFNRLQVTRKQKMTIEEQKKIVEDTNRHITDSINYAKRIQDALLPSEEEFKKYFPESFLFFRPKDIVSGDFFWLSHRDGKTVLAVADCTGHGVPGAFMSMIGNTLLNRIVNEMNILQPAEILSHLHEGVINALHQESRSQADGMDISVCLFDNINGKVTFAGANHSLYLADGESILKIEGDHFPIGSQFSTRPVNVKNNMNAFTQREVPVQKNTTVFLATDGYPDQKGGEQGQKFMSKRFRELLQKISGYPAKEQEQILRSTFEEWTNGKQQIDDVLVVGIRPSFSSPQT